MRISANAFHNAAIVTGFLSKVSVSIVTSMASIWISRKTYECALQKFPNHPNIVSAVSFPGKFFKYSPDQMRILGKATLIGIGAYVLITGVNHLVRQAWKRTYINHYEQTLRATK
jgi:hypothetical protein